MRIVIFPLPRTTSAARRCAASSARAFARSVSEQLGLKLESTWGPVDVLVIDCV